MFVIVYSCYCLINWPEEDLALSQKHINHKCLFLLYNGRLFLHKVTLFLIRISWGISAQDRRPNWPSRVHGLIVLLSSWITLECFTATYLCLLLSVSEPNDYVIPWHNSALKENHFSTLAEYSKPFLLQVPFNYKLFFLCFSNTQAAWLTFVHTQWSAHWGSVSWPRIFWHGAARKWTTDLCYHLSHSHLQCIYLLFESFILSLINVLFSLD